MRFDVVSYRANLKRRKRWKMSETSFQWQVNEWGLFSRVKIDHLYKKSLKYLIRTKISLVGNNERHMEQ